MLFSPSLKWSNDATFGIGICSYALNFISDSETQVWLCMWKYLHGSWVNGHWPMTHPKKWPIRPTEHDPSTHCLLWWDTVESCFNLILYYMVTAQRMCCVGLRLSLQRYYWHCEKYRVMFSAHWCTLCPQVKYSARQSATAYVMSNTTSPLRITRDRRPKQRSLSKLVFKILA